MSLKSNNSSVKNKIVENAKEKAFLQHCGVKTLKNESLLLQKFSTYGELVLLVFLVIRIIKVNNN